jgi:hypothetical protein
MLYVPKGADTVNTVFSTEVRPAAAMGVAVTPGSGAYGSWVQLFTALAYDAYGLWININTNFTSAASRNTILNIGIDVNGGTTYVTIIPDLICGNAGSYTASGGIFYHFPIFIKKGATIGVQGNGTVATAFRVFAKLFHQPAGALMLRVGSFCEVIGTAGNAGTTVTAGTTAEGAWTSLGTTTQKCWWWQLGVQVVASDVSHNAVLYHIDLAFGDATNKMILNENTMFYTTATENGQLFILDNGVECDVPAGATLYVRAQCSGTVDSLRIKAYGVGG